MSQSSFIAAMLLTGFVLFVAVEGRLNVYVAILTGAGASSSSAVSAPAGGSNPSAGGLLGELTGGGGPLGAFGSVIGGLF